MIYSDLQEILLITPVVLAKKFFIVYANNPSDAFRCVRKFLPNLHKACKLEIEQLTPGNIEEVKFKHKIV